MKNISEHWLDLPWNKLRQTVYRLQRRIYKASRVGDKAKVLSLQKLLMKSYAARMLAIRQVTQLNQGKKTAGIDGVLIINPNERFELERELKAKTHKWKHRKLREIKIPKNNGTRTLKIPTIADRAWQCLIKITIEPAHEASFHKRSYGFRPGRSAHDAQKAIFYQLRSNGDNKSKRVIQLDIEKCFDRISHKTILDNLIAPQSIKQGVFRCLKAGIDPEFPEQGTCQGGVVSPLLANVALNGIESIHTSIRYADDMVVILKSKDDENKIIDKINSFLTKRGMNINKKKTKITAVTNGFDFLGWHFKVKENSKFKSTPAKDNYKAVVRKIKNIVNNSAYGAEIKSKKLSPIVRGWRNYHKYCDMKNFNLWHVANRTWKVLNKQPKLNRKQVDLLINNAFPSVSYSVCKFINVKGDKSPYDGDLIYWSKRNSKMYQGATARTLTKQSHRCGHCQFMFIDNEKVHLHHVDGNHNNWKPNNLKAVHESCHDILHH